MTTTWDSSETERLPSARYLSSSEMAEVVRLLRVLEETTMSRATFEAARRLLTELGAR